MRTWGKAGAKGPEAWKSHRTYKNHAHISRTITQDQAIAVQTPVLVVTSVQPSNTAPVSLSACPPPYSVSNYDDDALGQALEVRGWRHTTWPTCPASTKDSSQPYRHLRLTSVFQSEDKRQRHHTANL